MPLSFPSSPSVNQTTTQNGRVYKWTGAAWEFVSSGGSGSGLTWSSVPASAAAGLLAARAGASALRWAIYGAFQAE